MIKSIISSAKWVLLFWALAYGCQPMDKANCDIYFDRFQSISIQRYYSDWSCLEDVEFVMVGVLVADDPKNDRYLLYDDKTALKYRDLGKAVMIEPSNTVLEKLNSIDIPVYARVNGTRYTFNSVHVSEIALLPFE